MAKSIKNRNAIACKLGPASTKATNHRLKFARKEWCKREEMVERQKTEAMAAKYCRDKRRDSLSSRKEENHESDTRDDLDSDKAKDKYPLQL